MFAAYRTRKIFRHGAATYDHAKIVKDRKGMEMVDYLRARRAVNDPPSCWISYAMKNKKFARAEFMKRWRLST